MPDNPWPRCSVLALGALPTAVPCARLHARQVLWEWRLGALREEAELVVSELVTNAVQATAGRQLPAPVRLRLSSDGSGALVEVWDADPRPPQPRAVDIDGVPDLVAESGRGLLLVAALSARWGWYPERQCGGKVVWAVLKAAPAASGDLAARFMSLTRMGGTSQLPRVRPRGTAHAVRSCPAVKGVPAMFDGLTDKTLRAAQDAARLLYDNHRALGLDPAVIKLDTLRVDIAVELENRGKPATPVADDTTAGA
jgi:anti-sigma regulatory factor (Ser/Thr protein kinase)